MEPAPLPAVVSERPAIDRDKGEGAVGSSPREAIQASVEDMVEKQEVEQRRRTNADGEKAN
jgi:hypothetical protein